MSRKVRRVVTGCDDAGQSTVLSDGEPPGIVSTKDFGRADLWTLPAERSHPECGGEHDPSGDYLEPPPGAIAWRSIRMAPADSPFQPRRQQLEDDPRYDASRPGMHRTDTIDWITIFDGEIELILDDDSLRLGPGDCAIQRGTWHAWRVVGDRPCEFGALMLRSIDGGDPSTEGGGPRTTQDTAGVGPRRVVTHLRSDGRSVFIQDSEPPNQLRLEHGAGMAYSDIWQTLGPVTSPAAGGDAPPGPFEFYALGGGVAWKHMVIPPAADLALVDPDALASEYTMRAPGMAAGGEHDPNRPGRHRTNSVDLVQILSGRITLELDTGPVELEPGDFVVQQGTWHTWNNHGDEPCVLQAMMVATQSARR